MPPSRETSGRQALGRGAKVGLLALCLAATGCATVRQAREAQDVTRVPAGERTVSAAEIGLTDQTLLTLDQALQIALAYHPAMVEARQNLVVASNQLRQAKAAWGPTVDTSAGYRRGTSNTSAARGSHESDDSYSAGLSLDQSLYDFGKTAASVKKSEALLQAARERVQGARNDVVFLAQVAFYDLGRAQELLAVAEETERQFLKRLEQVRGLVEVGRRIKYDITKVEVDLGNARLDLIKARNAVTVARATLWRRLGLAEEPLCRIAPEPLMEFQGVYAERMQRALLNQPELLALRAQVRAASATVDAAVAELYPSLSVSGEYLLNGGALPLIWNWAAAARFGMNLFNSGRSTAAINAAVAELRGARARVAECEQQIGLDLRTAFSQWEASRERQGLTVLIVRQAGENLELVTERYRLGQANSVEVTDAQADLSRARGEEVGARFDYQSAVAAILHTTGEE